MSRIKKSIVCLLAILLVMLTPLQAYAATGIEGLTDVNGFTVANASTTVWGLSSSAAGTMFYLCDKNGNKVANIELFFFLIFNLQQDILVLLLLLRLVVPLITLTLSLLLQVSITLLQRTGASHLLNRQMQVRSICSMSLLSIGVL